MSRPVTYLPTPADAPVVTITDLANGETWKGVMVDGIVHDASGIIDPDDVDVRFTVTLPPATTHTATRDAVLATRTGSLATYHATSDTWNPYTVHGPVPGVGNAVYGVGKHGNLVLITRTGQVPVRGRGAQVRVRISFARDTGDAAGTLAFDGEHIGGVAPAVLFTA